MKTSQTHRKHNKKVTPKSSKSLGELCAEYREIREKHGNQAASSKWMRRNGYRRVVSLARLKFELPWNEFKKKAGFDDSPLQKLDQSLSDLINDYVAIRSKYGNKAASSTWMRRNGYGRIYYMAHQKFELPWSDFKKKAGFDDPPFQKLDQSLSDLINDYAAIRSKHGNQAASSEWMMRNGYSRIGNMVRRKFKLLWSEFIAICSASYQLPEESMSFDVHLVEGAREN